MEYTRVLLICPPFTFVMLVSECLILSSVELGLPQCGDILLTKRYISNSEAEKQEGVGKRFGEINPTNYTPLLFQAVNFNIQSSNVTEAPGLQDKTNSAKTRSTIAFP